ncbi:MAG: hypothetical protein M3O70_15835 [Actinomycetota bacterium]|nr:hypothetical protein [Actinomycetota bacterium]
MTETAHTVRYEGTNGLATAGLVLGIVAAVLVLLPIIGAIAFPLTIIGGGLALAGFVRASRQAHPGRGKAIAGLVINPAVFVLAFVMAIAYTSAIDAGFEEMDRQMEVQQQEWDAKWDAEKAESNKRYADYLRCTNGIRYDDPNYNLKIADCHQQTGF